MRIETPLHQAISAVSGGMGRWADFGAPKTPVARPDAAQEHISTVLRNLVNLDSGLSNRGIDQLLGGARPGFGFGYSPRRGPNGAHLANHRQTYAPSTIGSKSSVAGRAKVNWGAFGLRSTVQNYLFHRARLAHPSATPEAEAKIAAMNRTLESLFLPTKATAMQALARLRV